MEGIKDLLMDCMAETRNDTGIRSVGKFLSCIRQEYGPTQEVGGIEKLQLVMGFKRKPEWSVRVFLAEISTGEIICQSDRYHLTD